MFSEYEYDFSIDFLSNLSIRIMKLMSLPLFSIFGRHFIGQQYNQKNRMNYENSIAYI